METGVYFGWASVDSGDVHKAVLSIGWNPFYENKEKSMVCACYCFQNTFSLSVINQMSSNILEFASYQQNICTLSLFLLFLSNSFHFV